VSESVVLHPSSEQKIYHKHRFASIRACRMQDNACPHTHVQADYNAEGRRRHGRAQRGLFVRGHQHEGNDLTHPVLRSAFFPRSPFCPFSPFSSLFSISPLCLSLYVSVSLFFFSSASSLFHFLSLPRSNARTVFLDHCYLHLDLRTSVCSCMHLHAYEVCMRTRVYASVLCVREREQFKNPNA
jgi:hypothetical protein